MTNLRKQKELASRVAGIGKRRIKVDSSMAEDLKEAITKADIKSLIAEGAIDIGKKQGVSRHRARARHLQRKKGRRRGYGRKKSVATARTPLKRKWINKIRLIRKYLKDLKENMPLDTYWLLYRRAKGGFFRDKRHVETYVKQHKLIKEVKK